MSRIERNPEVRSTALIPNERGADRALRAEVDAMALSVPSSESHRAPTLTFASLSAALRTALATGLARASGVAGMIRTDGASAATKLLLDPVSREGPPASARPPGAGRRA